MAVSCRKRHKKPYNIYNTKHIMKTRLLYLLVALLLTPPAVMAQQFVNLTPTPKTMSAGTGELVLPKTFSITTTNLSDDMKKEVFKFTEAFNAVTGYTVTVDDAASNTLITVETDASLGQEAYQLSVTDEGVNIKATAPAGLYFAFQTVKKVLPSHVMAGVKDSKVTRYALPFVNISDAPRYEHRSFMLDVSRHFFTVDEVKRMLDVMAYYKMNRFHWHLSDDQGWRVEIKKWPKLTEIGSIAPNCRVADIHYGQYYWTNKPYGPHFYTQEELRDVVAYAKERHIEIIPEIDMPGHFVAALVAYPEFSCNPNAGRSIWTNGGISSDVLNVANPAAIQFTKDILAEIIDIFPGEYIHIGGDECPTSAWEGNADCIKMKQELGLPNFRQLQSQFIKEIGGFIKEKGRKVAVWNEAITASGVDTDIIQDLDALVYCWIGADGAANKASQLGLKSIYTPQVPYYINRKQRPDDLNAGDGSDNLQRVYGVSPYNASLGIQGTFWTEHVSEPEHLEYQALPRLIAIAEAAWSPQAKRNFTDFQKRITADSAMLNYNNYYYNRDYMTADISSEKVMPEVSTTAHPYYYRIVTRATGARANRCWELLRDGSPLISEYAGKNATAGKLWTNDQANEGDEAYDYQLWAFEQSPDNPDKYAIVCKAQPKGSLNPTPTAATTAGRWNYDSDTKHYNFILGEGNYYGKADGAYYYSIRSSKVSGQYLNASLGGQGFAVNVYGNPADGNGGLFLLFPIAAEGGTNDLATLLSEVKLALSLAKTYDGEAKTPGAYGASEAAALHLLADNADLSSMTEEEMAQFATDLSAAYEAFLASFGYLETGKTYRFTNTIGEFIGTSLADNGTGSHLVHTTDVWGNDAWEVTESTVTNHVQNVKLQNVGTGRLIGASATSSTGNIGFPVSIGQSGTNVALNFNLSEGDYTLSSNGKNLFPVPYASGTLPGIISSGSNAGDQASNAFRPMGTAWSVTPVLVYTYNCKDEAGNSLGTYTRSVAESGNNPAEMCPSIKNHKVKSTQTNGNTVEVIYERIAYSITLVARDQYGALLSNQETSTPVGTAYTVKLPAPKYYTLLTADKQEGETFKPEADMILEASYETNAYSGVKAVHSAVKELTAGRSYLIYDNSDANNGARKGFRTVLEPTKKINRVGKAEGATPYTTWTFVKSGNGFKVKNEYLNKYVPTFSKSENPTVSSTGGVFTFTANTDGSWKIQGSNGVCWDGNENGQMVGWDAPGHPHLVYEYYVEPYFEVKIQYVNTEGKTLSPQTSTLVKAGSAYTLVTPTIQDYILKEVENNEGLGEVSDNITVKVIYETDPMSGIGTTEADKAEKGNGIYDLSGRRLNRITGQGIYIINGQKVLVK